MLFKLQDCVLELELHYVELCRSLIVGIKCRVAYWFKLPPFCSFSSNMVWLKALGGKLIMVNLDPSNILNNRVNAVNIF